MFDNLKKDNNIEEEKDVLGGGGPLDSAIYKAKVDMAYMGESQGGALNVTLHLVTEDKRQIRSTIYITSGKEKGQLNYYEKNGEKHYLPGFVVIDSLCQLTVGHDLADVAANAEKKLVNIYNYDQQKEVPTEVPVLEDLLDQEIYVGLLKVTEDKKKQGDDGKYYPTGETRDINEIDKFFCARDGYEGMTSAEIRAKAEEPVFFNKWKEKNTGKTVNKAKGAAAGNGKPGAPGAVGTASGTSKPKKSLFGS
jgi:hypothetical protein